MKTVQQEIKVSISLLFNDFIKALSDKFSGKIFF